MKTGLWIVLVGLLVAGGGKHDEPQQRPSLPVKSAQQPNLATLDVFQRLQKEQIPLLNAVLAEEQDMAARVIQRPDDPWRAVVEGIVPATQKGLFVIHVELHPAKTKASALAAMPAAQREKIMLDIVKEFTVTLGLTPMPGYGRPLGAIQMMPLRYATGWTEDAKTLLRAELARRSVLLLTWTHAGGTSMASRNIDRTFSYAEEPAKRPK